MRIRISLGGIEHTTLESLKQNITPEILDFTDGRLLRWLERQNEVVVLDKIKKITNSNDKEDNANLLELYNALLNAHKKNLLDFIYEWGNDDNRSKDLAKYILETNLDAFPGLIDYHFPKNGRKYYCHTIILNQNLSWLKNVMKYVNF